MSSASAGNPGDRFLPHPDADWYDRTIGTTGGGIEYVFNATPDQRRSYVRFILAGHGGERSNELFELVNWEPSALAPWADAVTDFDDAALVQLSEVEWPDYWHAAFGASDAAADRLAVRIAADPPPESAADGTAGRAALARVWLLAGVDTDRALERLAELGRRFATVREVCEETGLSVPPTGPAVRRFERRRQRIVQVDPSDGPPGSGLRVLPPAGDIFVDPRQDCALPLSVVLDVDFSLLPAFPMAARSPRRHPFVGSFCQDCEADEDIRGDRGWLPVTGGPHAGKLRFDEDREERCPGFDREALPERPYSLVLRPSDRYRRFDHRVSVEEFGWLGGRPSWAQYPVWLGCCDKPMFFVGQTCLYHFGGVGAHMYGFVCECGAGNQVAQIT